ncbi:hypothetical protein ACQ33O_10110 [Ferruginibacter sp. SUN002]|uniref:hypothetical protein n=1 Tax=Ferruginibacter sp. SUN002 TaxID=2937789 RepID=UPI003D362071
MKISLLFAGVTFVLFFSSCKKDSSAGAKVIFKFKFDSTQIRLNNLGVAATMPAGHAGQSPRFNSMSAHYVEMTPDQFTLLGAGAVLYRAPETNIGGSNAIDFSKAKFAGNNEVFLSVPVTGIAAGNYNWLRVSLAYQNYNVYVEGSGITAGITVDATVASFIGFNTYLSSFKIDDSTVVVNGNKAQGYWATEGHYLTYGNVQTGQAPAGSTTVPNPLFATSPIPAGSCVVTGQFASPLVITGNETSDINITVSLSTNKSFEWIDVNGNGKFEPTLSPTAETVVDMGIRGLIPIKM